MSTKKQKVLHLLKAYTNLVIYCPVWDHLLAWVACQWSDAMKQCSDITGSYLQAQPADPRLCLSFPSTNHSKNIDLCHGRETGNKGNRNLDLQVWKATLHLANILWLLCPRLQASAAWMHQCQIFESEHRNTLCQELGFNWRQLTMALGFSLPSPNNTDFNVMCSSHNNFNSETERLGKLEPAVHITS